MSFCRTALLLAAAAIPSWTQPRFEVASIRPSDPGLTARDARIRFRGDRFEAHAATVGDILDMLGGWQLHRVVGGPPWMRTDRYDIEAKADRTIEQPDGKKALMTLLADRFHLETRQETREIPGVVLRAPKAALKTAAEGEAYGIRTELPRVIFTAVPMSGLTNYLSQMLAAPVVDETGLKGAYDFVFDATSLDQQPGQTWGDRVREAAEALGFRLEARKIPLEVTVIDRCDRPTSN